MDTKLVADCETGAVVEVPLTADDLADRDARIAAAAEPHPDPIAEADAAFYTAMSAATTVAQIKAATLAWMLARPGIAAPAPANG